MQYILSVTYYRVKVINHPQPGFPALSGDDVVPQCFHAGFLNYYGFINDFVKGKQVGMLLFPGYLLNVN